MRRRGQVIRYENSKCVWKLKCPYCGWLFGFCLDVTGRRLFRSCVYLVNGAVRVPTHSAKVEGGRVFVYFKRRRQVCTRCKALLVPEDDLVDWLSSHEVRGIDIDDLDDFARGIDPEGKVARVCSDRVYDVHSEEWGTDGMPCRYLVINNESELLRRIGVRAQCSAYEFPRDDR